MPIKLLSIQLYFSQFYSQHVISYELLTNYIYNTKEEIDKIYIRCIDCQQYFIITTSKHSRILYYILINR